MNADRYISVKEVYADPMSLGDYYDTIGIEIPVLKDKEKSGYIVTGMDGVRSWIEKEQFEKEYKKA